jgi:hypothetical protein
VSGDESVHGAVPVSAALAKPAVVAVPVHRVTDPHAKWTPEQSRFAEHLARRPRFPSGSSANRKLAGSPAPGAIRQVASGGQRLDGYFPARRRPILL